MPKTKEQRLARQRMEETGESYQQALIYVREHRPDAADAPEPQVVAVPAEHAQHQSPTPDQAPPSSPAASAADVGPATPLNQPFEGPNGELNLPEFDPETELRVRLDPVRRSMYLDDPLARAGMTTFIFPKWLTPYQKEIVTRFQQFLGNLARGWTVSSKEVRQEALLELQAELDDLGSLGLVLAMGGAEQIVLPPPGLPMVPPKRYPTLIVSVLRKGEVARWEVVTAAIVGRDTSFLKGAAKQAAEDENDKLAADWMRNEH
jgi:hypothetical protein